MFVYNDWVTAVRSVVENGEIEPAEPIRVCDHVDLGDRPCVIVKPSAELIRGYLQAVGKRRRCCRSGCRERPYRDGENLSLGGAGGGTRAWEDFLAERLGRSTGTADHDRALPRS